MLKKYLLITLILVSFFTIAGSVSAATFWERLAALVSGSDLTTDPATQQQLTELQTKIDVLKSQVATLSQAADTLITPSQPAVTTPIPTLTPSSAKGRCAASQLPTADNNQTIRCDGKQWVANSTLSNNGTSVTVTATGETGSAPLSLVNPVDNRYGWSFRLFGGRFVISDNAQFTDRLVISNNGNVGLGPISAPQEKLDLGGGNIKMGYEVVSFDQFVGGPPNYVFSVTIQCPTGKKVLNGGPVTLSPDTDWITNSYPDVSGDSWTIKGRANTGASRNFRAICANIR